MQDSSADGEDPVAWHGQRWTGCRSGQFCSPRAEKTRVSVTKGHHENTPGTNICSGATSHMVSQREFELVAIALLSPDPSLSTAQSLGRCG